MTTLKMDIDNCTLIHGRFVTVSRSLDENLGSLSSSVGRALEAAWKGRSAVEFLEEFNRLKHGLDVEVQSVKQQVAALGTAITQYQDIDREFG
ncbi:MAG: WXG100 family type VII secretion target [Anaerolineales bacterium]|nr:WXG100 family type VII secretion target [Anaerolineales bacterium]